MPRATTKHGGQGRSRREYSCSREDFVRIWNSSDYIDDIAAMSGLPVNICYTRATQYRAQGVIMEQPRPRRKKPSVLRRESDVEKLNAIAKQAISMKNGGRLAVLEELLGRPRS